VDALGDTLTDDFQFVIDALDSNVFWYIIDTCSLLFPMKEWNE